MRRPHVYERSAPRARPDTTRTPQSDYTSAAQAVLQDVPALLRHAEASGAVTLARYLGQALSEAESIMRRR